MKAITPIDAHELYIQLTDIQAQLENEADDVRGLEEDRDAIYSILQDNGYNPEFMPEELYSIHC